MNEKNICICDLNDCKLYLEDPIALSCGSTICKQHVDNFSTIFNCPLCKQEHLIPQNGFRINNTLSKIIKTGLHLDKLHKSTSELFKKLDSIIKEYNSIDSETFIYDYFSIIRNKIDLHREKLIEEIHERSDEMVSQLNELEKEFKLNAAKLEKKTNNFKNIELNLWKSQLRMPDINENQIYNLNEIFNKMINNVQNDVENYKNDLLMDRSIDFQPFNNNLFGQMKIKCNKISFTNDFGKCLKTFKGQHTDLIRTFQVDHESKKLITGSNDCTIKIWNLETSECLKTLHEHKGWVTSILPYSKNKFISSSDDKTIKIWCLENYECHNTLTNELGVFCMCFLSEDTLAVGCCQGKIIIWNLNNFSLINSFEAHDETITCLKLTDNSKLVSCSGDTKIKVWNIEPFECLNCLSGHNDFIYCLELTSNGRLISGSEDKKIRIWDLENGMCLTKIELDTEIYSIKSLSNDIIVIGSSSKDNIIFYDIKRMEMVKKMDHMHNDFVFCLNVLENDVNLVSASRDNTVKIWKI